MPKPNLKLRTKGVPAPKPIVQRVRDPLTFFSTVIKDERSTPRLRVLAVLAAKYFALGVKHGKEVPMSPQETVDKLLLHNILMTQYGNSRLLRTIDGDDIETADTDDTDALKAAIDAALKPSQKEE